MVTYLFSRSASYYESGIGRGMGFRDSCQDLLGFVHLIPEKAKQRIIDIASIQKKDGSTYHQYQPLTKRGNSDIGSGFNDDPLWLIAATSAYLKETGDYPSFPLRSPSITSRGAKSRFGITSKPRSTSPSIIGDPMGFRSSAEPIGTIASISIVSPPRQARASRRPRTKKPASPKASSSPAWR
jgi:hypothetical protein